MNSFTDGSAFCPGAPKRVPSDSEKHRRVYTSSNVCHSHEWRVDTASGKTLKKRNACSDVCRSAVQNKILGLTVLRSGGVKLREFNATYLCRIKFKHKPKLFYCIILRIFIPLLCRLLHVMTLQHMIAPCDALQPSPRLHPTITSSVEPKQQRALSSLKNAWKQLMFGISTRQREGKCVNQGCKYFQDFLNCINFIYLLVYFVLLFYIDNPSFCTPRNNR